ncbi:hypothetical protein [Devriesea agamarum]|uniref:hypothetical protein n=1 Tax=Devriesea agamarum TaxID=472569 RepID=UPI00071D9892|nr:hypothetical protein [Devriesea agamarum]
MPVGVDDEAVFESLSVFKESVRCFEGVAGCCLVTLQGSCCVAENFYALGLDAFDERLSDLDWLPPTLKFLLIIDGIHEVLANTSNRGKNVFEKCIRTARSELKCPLEW